MFQGQTLCVRPAGQGFLNLCFDRRDGSVNKLDVLALNELREALELIQTQTAISGLLVSSAKDSFIVGADLDELASLMSREQPDIARVNSGQSAIFNLFESLPFPTVALINGLALGGGFEVCLACDFRVMAEDAQVGLPEVGLGLFPAFGGSVRLPRLLGVSEALAWIASARPYVAQAALTQGAVDCVVPMEQLEDAGLQHLRGDIESAVDWPTRRLQRRQGAAPVNSQVFMDARHKAQKTQPHVASLHDVIDLIEQSIYLERDAALTLESRAFARTMKSQSAAGLVRVFLNQQVLKRKAKEYSRVAGKPKNAGVLGAGIMGGGIAYTSAVRGTPVLMKDINDKALMLGMNEAGKLLDRQVSNGRMSAEQATQTLNQIRPTLEYGGFSNLDVVVEAVIENLAIKKQVLAEVEQRCKVNAVLASNTSSLSIAELATALQRPENFVGMHFFNPVPVMPLVEVICGPQTSPHAAASIASYASVMGKSAVVVKDCPGFLVNRILTAYILAFLRLIHDGANFVQIDEAMQGFGWPMGPAYLQDVVGMDTSSHVIEHIAQGYGERLIAPFKHAVEHLAGMGRFGQKSGHGFYRHTTDPAGKPLKALADDSHAVLAQIQPNGTRAFTDQVIIERMMLPMLIESARCLEEGVAGSAEEIDMALILGIGLPRHLGGALSYADWLGLPEILSQCQRYADLGGLYQPTEQMIDMAARCRTYYPRQAAATATH
jgi:3-hydroxyacyl-CoA dehydrogenase/enoyl-CoA hydratase/3-hydroxybutyryl-CoA epimerase/enoyl-CoA isomerase